MDDTSENTNWEQIAKLAFIALCILALLAMLFIAFLLPSLRGD